MSLYDAKPSRSYNSASTSAYNANASLSQSGRLSLAEAVDLGTNPYLQDFPLLKNYPHLAFLDSAATAQRPACVLDAMRYFYEKMNANPLRGLYSLSVEATQAINEVRAKIAHFIGAKNPDEVIFCRNTSEALNMVALSFGNAILEPGDEVCITIMEHHSNLIPWQQVCAKTGAHLVYLYSNQDGVITSEEMDEKIGPATKILSVAQVSNVLGVENPVAELGRRVHKQGGYLVVDGAQSVPHEAVDIAALDADFFAFSAHKMFGPLGIGVLWGKMDCLNSMPPFLTGGEMIDSVTQTSAVWAPVPEKFEAGTQDAAGIFACGTAIDYINTIGYDKIAAREQELMGYAMEALSKLPFIEMVGPTDPKVRHGVISFNVKDIHPHDVSSILDGCNVAIRAGHHCAQPLLNWMGIESCCRASVAFYNDAHDIDALVAGLKTVWSMFNG